MRDLHASELITSPATAFANPFIRTSVLVALGGIATAVLAEMLEPKIMFFGAALLCGWGELAGACGMSHIATLTPLRNADKDGRFWLRAVALYTFGGLVTSALVGLILGLIGDALPFSQRVVQATVVLMSLVLIGQALGWVPFLLPQVWRQTNKFWALEFGILPAAAMWGAHIGIGFATVIAHGGIFVVTFAAASHGPRFGALLFMTFWVGRTLPLWILPSQLGGDWNTTPRLVEAFPYLKAVAVLGMSIIVIALASNWAWI